MPAEHDGEATEVITHDEFEPIGTLALVALYFAVLVVMWTFMYYVEFLGRINVVG